MVIKLKDVASNQQFAMENHNVLIGKSTISMASSNTLNYQRVVLIHF